MLDTFSESKYAGFSKKRGSIDSSIKQKEKKTKQSGLYETRNHETSHRLEGQHKNSFTLSLRRNTKSKF